MPRENEDAPNTVKYSIWETRTDHDQMEAKQRITESIQSATLDSTIAEKQEEQTKSNQ
ncbi:hypothetical protein [Bacillus xiapuensis]|uniref:Uncharacterized protein n=1 Tax=Bacillus xiapuensis TaxID=2014075 RepID=A0ABU6N507_9BACI|nr:hypothetical protein [Bacillus xiapuensis]